MLVALLACHAPPEAGFGRDKGDDSAGTEGTTDDSATNADSGTTDAVIADATEGKLTVAFDVGIVGQGSEVVDDVSVVDDVGTLSVFGTKQNAVVWLDELWDTTRLYFTLSIPDDGSTLNVTYLYCDGDELAYVYALGFGRVLAGENATGKCPRVDTAIDVPVHLPALVTLPDPVATDIDIEGDEISLHEGAGTLSLGAVDYDVVPFGTVDCSTCATPGWYELHLLMTRADEACYGVLYLFANGPDTVELAWTLCVPSLEAPAPADGVFFDAGWSGSIETARAPSTDLTHWHPPPRIPSP